MAFAGWWLNLDGAPAPISLPVPGERIGRHIIQSINDGNIFKHNASIVKRQMPSKQFAFLLDRELKINYGISRIRPPAFIEKSIVDDPSKDIELPVLIRNINKDRTVDRVKGREFHGPSHFVQQLIAPNFRKKFINNMF